MLAYYLFNYRFKIKAGVDFKTAFIRSVAYTRLFCPCAFGLRFLKRTLHEPLSSLTFTKALTFIVDILYFPARYEAVVPCNNAGSVSGGTANRGTSRSHHRK